MASLYPEALGRIKTARIASGADPFDVMASQERKLVDGAGSKPAYNLRTLCRALEYARAVLPVYGLQRSLYDGCSMAFHTQLAPSSAPLMNQLLQTHILGPGTTLKVGSLAHSAWLSMQRREIAPLSYSAGLMRSKM